MIDAAPGAIGRYTILGELGRGATGSVYLARDAFADRNVAIKVFRHAGENPSLGGQHRSAFLTEAALVGKLTHPHIVALLDAAGEQAHSYVVRVPVPLPVHGTNRPLTVSYWEMVNSAPFSDTPE